MYQTNDLYSLLKESLKHHNNILISGAPGVGKSEITYQVCQDLGLKLYETRLYELGETAAGLPILDKENKRMDFAKPFWFEDVLEGNYDALFFDDFHQVVQAIQKYLYRTLTSRMLHNYQLPENIKIIVAGNFELDSANSSPIQSPIMSRFDLAIKYEPSIDNFLKWASSNKKFDTRVLAFLKAHPDLLYTPDPPTSEMFPCPRTWEYVSKEISVSNKPDLVPGIVGPRAGGIFQEFWSLLDKEPEDILKIEPNELEAQEQVAATFILAKYYISNFRRNEQVTDRILNYISKFPSDILFLFARTVVMSLQMKFINEIRTKEKHKHIVDTLLEISNQLN